jgi:hypothetical protein
MTEYSIARTLSLKLEAPDLDSASQHRWINLGRWRRALAYSSTAVLVYLLAHDKFKL